MALSQVHFLSQALARIVTFHVYLPNDTTPEFTDDNPHYERPVKTLYLLHGFSGNTTDWIMGSSAMEISRRYNIAIVMPSGENSFYLDRRGTGGAYETYIAKELPEYIKKTYHLPDDRTDVFIGGLSMGGFGALRLGIKYSEKFGAAFGLSSALIVEDIAGISPGDTTSCAKVIADYDYYINVFGDLQKVRNSDVDPKYIVRQHIKNKEIVTPVFMACGTEDFLLENNRDFRDFLKDCGADVTYYESPGTHEWKFWNEYLEPAVKWAIEKSEDRQNYDKRAEKSV